MSPQNKIEICLYEKHYTDIDTHFFLLDNKKLIALKINKFESLSPSID